MALREALSKLNEAINDLTSLHVQTFTGTMEWKLSDGKIKSVEDVMNDGTASGNLKFVADSIFKFDGDSINFITDASYDSIDKALTCHQNAIKSGLETRVALMNMFKDIIK